MSAIRKIFDKLRPHFEEGGKLHPLQSVFDGFETFALVPNTTSKSGVHVHDALDSKRIMSFVVIALLPCLLFGMYNLGYQNYAAAGVSAPWYELFGYGFLRLLPKLVVSYVVGLGIEFVFAQVKHEEIQEGYLVTGMMIPLILPIGCPLWMMIIAIAFAVIFVKELFGGTGMNIFNVALSARAFLFFSYPTKMSGESVWISRDSFFGLGNQLPDAFTAATPLGEVATGNGAGLDVLQMVTGLYPGSVGETSVIAIAIGAVILLWTGIASWKVMLSVFVGGGLTALLFQSLGMTPISWVEHLCLGGFCFGAVFMATDPVTGSRTEIGKPIYGFLIGVVAVLVRVLNPGYPEGMMMAILLMNIFAPLIDYLVVDSNIRKRMRRSTK